MTNHLDNGTVLPHGLLGENLASDMMEGFNKSYKNFPLRIGVVIASYLASDDNNISKLTTEYDVSVIEQNADKGATTIVYRNCMSAESLGSIADYLEMALRPKVQKTTPGDSINLNGQDGAIVLMLCLDGMSDKGIIIASLTHPDRETNLTEEGPLLEGEYNGVHIKVAKDGSTSLVFNGATDNQGKPIDTSQGTTTAQIEKDGSFQIDNDKITLRLDKDGTYTVKAKKDIVLNTEANVTIKASKDVKVDCQNATVTASQDATVEGINVKLGKNAAQSVIKGDAFKAFFSTHTHPTAVGPSGPPTQPFTPDLLSIKVKTE